MDKTDVMQDEWVTRKLARLMYLVYCRHNGSNPFHGDYVPAWALDYAQVAVEVLGYDEEGVSSLSEQLEVKS